MTRSFSHHLRTLWRASSPTASQMIAILAMIALSLVHCSCVDADNLPPLTATIAEHFEKHVRPLLAEHCYSCHSTKAKKLRAELFLDSRTALLRGGESGAAVVPGEPDDSLLIEAVRYEGYEMPPRGKLPDDAIEHLVKWVRDGAYWPDEPEPTATEQPASSFDLQARRESHWAWRPIADPPSPVVQNSDWPLAPIDNFILNKLESQKIAAGEPADRSSLLRRLYFDLIGLPPTVAQVERFMTDTSDGALRRVVDELLDSPHFGERWGRHWLDLARYAESRGHEFDNDALNAFQYRDYVIRALNADVPYDQFVLEHIAGDLLAKPRLNTSDRFNESILGTGFWFLGEWVHSPVDIRKDETDRFDNMIDVMSKMFLGVTVSCARCHDHKFDAISTADYYSLSGFLQSSDYRQVRFESIEQNRVVAKKLAELRDRATESLIESLPKSLVQRWKQLRFETHESSPSMVIDYTSVPEDGWIQDGFIFGDRPRLAGEFCLDISGDRPRLRVSHSTAATNDPMWNGLKSLSQSNVQSKSKLTSLPRSGRTLRTPTFELSNGNVACRVHGSGHVVACVDSHRLVAGPLHGETVQDIKPDTTWVRLKLDRYVGHRVHLEFTPAEDSLLDVFCVMQGASNEEIKRRDTYQSDIEVSVTEFEAELDRYLAENHDDREHIDKIIRSWQAERRALEKFEIAHESRLAMAMMDGTGEDDHVLIRGNSANPGAVEPRHFLTAIAGEEPLSIRTRSGRLELAECINDPANPLTSRVIVNRIWHHLMGRGIVPTTDDFGVLGLRPTHPDLLDHLATQFRRDGLSIKRMIRYIVLSRTYQMSSRADSRASEIDPKNLLWHHRPPKRLEGEVIRDALLAISGRLDTKQFGEPIPIHLTSFMDGRGRPRQSGPLDGNSRRSIYSAVRRNFLSPFMLTFDTPVPFSAMGRRNVSNVPAQALIMLNDPLVVQQSRLWAERAMTEVPRSEDWDTAKARIDWMYQTAFARQPTNRERNAALKFCLQQASELAQSHESVDVWADLAHALVNAKEFIFLR